MRFVCGLGKLALIALCIVGILIVTHYEAIFTVNDPTIIVALCVMVCWIGYTLKKMFTRLLRRVVRLCMLFTG